MLTSASASGFTVIPGWFSRISLMSVPSSKVESCCLTAVGGECALAVRGFYDSRRGFLQLDNISSPA